MTTLLFLAGAAALALVFILARGTSQPHADHPVFKPEDMTTVPKAVFTTLAKQTEARAEKERERATGVFAEKLDHIASGYRDLAK